MAHQPFPGKPLSLMRIEVPPDIPVQPSSYLYQAPSPEQVDRRLKGYNLIFLLKVPTDDPPPVVYIQMDGKLTDGWQLLYLAMKVPGMPVAVELWHDPVHGWGPSTHAQQHATPRDIIRAVHAMAVLQGQVKSRGRQKGTRRAGVGTHEDLESFLNRARRQRDQWRALGKTFTQESLAHALGMTEASFKRGLRKCQPRLIWDSFLDLP